MSKRRIERRVFTLTETAEHLKNHPHDLVVMLLRNSYDMHGFREVSATYREIRTWIADSCAGYVAITPVDAAGITHISSAGGAPYLSFELETDVVQFKMRFCDIV